MWSFFTWNWRRAAALSFAALPLSVLSERQYRALPALLPAGRPNSESGPLPSLSIVVPARNEEKNLRRLLPSLRSVRYPGELEIIVVDDSSTDSTAELAAQWGARVIAAGALPAGWLGKPHACHLGAVAARGEWVLFTDADTRHAPDGPAQAVRYATAHGLDGLSLFLHQETQGVADRLALMVAFAALYASLRPDGMLNGQYILLRRTAYLESGGFGAVRGEALEDLALGNLLRGQGYSVPLLHGDEAASVRMYDDTAQIWHGMTRLGAGAMRWSGGRSLITALFISALMSPILALAGVLTGRLDRRWLPAAWLAVAVSMLTWGRRYGSALWAPLAPAAALVIQAAAVWGMVNRLVGRGFYWKGRRV